MLNYIALYPNEYEDMMNPDIILGAQDTPIEDFIIMAMQEFEAIENIKKMYDVHNNDNSFL